jgi:hypothetical protein
LTRGIIIPDIPAYFHAICDHAIRWLFERVNTVNYGTSLAAGDQRPGSFFQVVGDCAFRSWV